MNPGDPLEALDWPGVTRALDSEGHARLPAFFGAAQVQVLAALAGADAGRASMAAPTPPHGAAMALAPPWPDFLALARAALRRGLQPVARRWCERLGGAGAPAGAGPDGGVPLAGARLDRLRAGQWQPLRGLGADATGSCPFALVALLGEPGREFSGGELVLTERRPRMQSRPVVVPLRRGDAAVVATGPRPCRGANGWYRSSLRLAVGRVREGERLGLLLRIDDDLGAPT
jgi:hypothetical protein